MLLLWTAAIIGTNLITFGFTMRFYTNRIGKLVSTSKLAGREAIKEAFNSGWHDGARYVRESIQFEKDDPSIN